jgi:hypothetical protein
MHEAQEGFIDKGPPREQGKGPRREHGKGHRR